MNAVMKWAEKVDSIAKANIQKKQKQLNAKHRPSTFKAGDKVWVYNARKDTRKGGRLSWKWKGPFEIVEQTKRRTHRLKNNFGHQLKQAVSSNRLKLYRTGNSTMWF